VITVWNAMKTTLKKQEVSAKLAANWHLLGFAAETVHCRSRTEQWPAEEVYVRHCPCH